MDTEAREALRAFVAGLIPEWKEVQNLRNWQAHALLLADDGLSEDEIKVNITQLWEGAKQETST